MRLRALIRLRALNQAPGQKRICPLLQSIAPPTIAASFAGMRSSKPADAPKQPRLIKIRPALEHIPNKTGTQFVIVLMEALTCNHLVA